MLLFVTFSNAVDQSKFVCLMKGQHSL